MASGPGRSVVDRLTIAHTWDGKSVPRGEQVELGIAVGPEGLRLRVYAPFHGDPAPPGPPGSTWGLWDFEAVELFLVAADDSYLELELGPHGHFLLLRLRGRRNIVDRHLPLGLSDLRREEDRWSVEARISSAVLPPQPWRVNAFALHGNAPERRFLAWAPVPGREPDFHRIESFPPWPRHPEGQPST